MNIADNILLLDFSSGIYAFNISVFFCICTYLCLFLCIYMCSMFCTYAQNASVTEEFPLFLKYMDYPQANTIWLCPYSKPLKPAKGFWYYLLITFFTDWVWRKTKPLRQLIYPSLGTISRMKEGKVYFEGKNSAIPTSSRTINITMSVSAITFFPLIFIHLFSLFSHLKGIQMQW